MSKPKHTPAPWRMGTKSGIKDGNGDWITPPCVSIFASDETEFRGATSICTVETRNASLVVTAPELLKVCEEAFSFLKETGNAHRIMTRLEEAIAKARRSNENCDR